MTLREKDLHHTLALTLFHAFARSDLYQPREAKMALLC